MLDITFSERNKTVEVALTYQTFVVYLSFILAGAFGWMYLTNTPLDGVSLDPTMSLLYHGTLVSSFLMFVIGLFEQNKLTCILNGSVIALLLANALDVVFFGGFAFLAATAFYVYAAFTSTKN